MSLGFFFRSLVMGARLLKAEVAFGNALGQAYTCVSAFQWGSTWHPLFLALESQLKL